MPAVTVWTTRAAISSRLPCGRITIFEILVEGPLSVCALARCSILLASRSLLRCSRTRERVRFAEGDQLWQLIFDEVASVGTSGALTRFQNADNFTLAYLRSLLERRLPMNLFRSLLCEKCGINAGKPSRSRLRPGVQSLEDRCLAAVDAFIWFDQSSANVAQFTGATRARLPSRSRTSRSASRTRQQSGLRRAAQARARFGSMSSAS